MVMDPLDTDYRLPRSVARRYVAAFLEYKYPDDCRQKSLPKWQSASREIDPVAGTTLYQKKSACNDCASVCATLCHGGQ
ncbi:MAG: hypothetical protein R3F47_08125 [Gammaproteobacteria bacterium]